MKVFIALLLATTALAAITSANNAQTSHVNVKDVEDAHALAEGQLGWIPEADNQLSYVR